MASAILTLVMAVPAILFLAPQDTLAWVGQASLGGMVKNAVSAMGGPIAAPLLFLLVMWGLAQLPGARHRDPSARWPEALLVLIGAAFLVLLPLQSLFVNEYLTIELVPVSLVAVRGLEALRPEVPAAAVVAAGLAAGLGLQGVQHKISFDPSDWSGMVGQLAQAVQPGDAIGFPNSFYRNVFEYYMDREGATRLAAAHPVLPEAPWYAASAYTLDRTKRLGLEVTPDQVRVAIPSYESIWLVAPDGDELLLSTERHLDAEGYRVGETLTADGGVVAIQMRRS